MQISQLVTLPRRMVAHTQWMLRDPQHFFEHRDNKRNPEKRRQRLLGFDTMPPYQIQLDPANDMRPSLNVLLPRLGRGQLTGGPNTAIQIAVMLSLSGIPVRIVAVDEALPADMAALWQHLQVLAGVGTAIPNLSFASTISPETPARLGRRDIFLATSWTTAYRLKAILGDMARPEFVYLIQDFEPSFYPWSSSYAQATETYGMPYHALINEQLLADYFAATGTGRFADPSFLATCGVFEPAVDQRLFYPVDPAPGPKRLLFYARPGNDRNLFGIGFEALRAATEQPLFAGADWRFVSIGDSSLGPMPLGGGRVLEPAPWLSYEEYGQLIRESDILLCPMLSPHTSYPVLEMGACRGIAVTNMFGPKTQARLEAMSAGIIAGPPTIEGLRDALLAAARASAGNQEARRPRILPADWPTALARAVGTVEHLFAAHVEATERPIPASP